MKRFLIHTSLAIALAAHALPAFAADTSLMGDQLRVNWARPDENTLYPAFYVDGKSQYDFTVGDGVEGIGDLPPTGQLSFDFAAHSLTLTMIDNLVLNRYAFNGLVFRELDGSSFGIIDSVIGIEAAAVRAIDNRLLVNLAGQRFSAGDTITVQFQTGVPEPASWALLIVGFGVCGAMLRRAQKLRCRVAFA